MNNISMRVDLSHFFSDARRNTLIFIDALWENINDVQDHIQKLFRLSNISLLTQDGYYLPPKESIRVLNSVESLKAFKLNEEELEDASALLTIEETRKKRKKRSAETDFEFSSSTPNNPKRSKSKNDTLVQKEQSTLRAENICEQRQTRQSTKKYSMQQTAMCEETEDLDMTEGCSIGKTNATIDNSSPNQREATHHDIDVHTSLKAEANSNSHIIYKDAEAVVSTALEASCQASKATHDIEFRSPLLEMDSSLVRKFQLPRKPDPVKILEDIVIPAPLNMGLPAVKTPQKNGQTAVEPLEAQVATDNGATEAEVPVEKNIPTNTTSKSVPANEVYEVEQECVELEDNPATDVPFKVTEHSLLESDSEDDVMVLDDTNLDDSDSADIVADMLQNAVPLTTIPNVGETVIFKLPKLRGASPLSPKTEYIAGTCSYINRRTKFLTVSVIACANAATKQVLNQYLNRLDDSTDAAIVLNVNFRDLIEPRVIVSLVD